MPFPQENRGAPASGPVWALVHGLYFSALAAADWSSLGNKVVNDVTVSLSGSGITTFGPNGSTGLVFELASGSNNAAVATSMGALAAAASHTLDAQNDYCLLLHFASVPTLGSGNFYGAFIRNEGGGDHNNLRGYCPVVNHSGSLRFDFQNTTSSQPVPPIHEVLSSNPRSIGQIYRKGRWYEGGFADGIAADPSDLYLVGASAPAAGADLVNADMVDLPYPLSSDLICNPNVGTSGGAATPAVVLADLELWVLPAAA